MKTTPTRGKPGLAIEADELYRNEVDAYIDRNRDELNASIRRSRDELGKCIQSERTVSNIIADGRTRHGAD